MIVRVAITCAVVSSGLLVTAQAAQASWLEQSTPAVPAATAWELTAVSCTSPNICMAVGDGTGENSQLIAERRDGGGGGWTLVSIPQPAVGSLLSGISCTSATACIAAGTAPSGLNTVPLSEKWNGSSWQILTTARVAGSQTSELSAVSCTSATKCTAVGSTQTGNRVVALAERWDGTKWRIEATANQPPAGATELSGVSCTSATSCTAVGSRAAGSTTLSLAEHWNGSHWLPQPTPGLSGGHDSGLNSVSCSSGSSCMAGGTGLAERWNGTKWSLLKIAKPGGGTPATLSAVSCVRAGVCYAAGGFFADGVLTLAAEFWNGTRWSVQDAPITTSQDSSTLASVSCTTATNCTAVGSYHDPVNGNRALAENFALHWQDQSPPALNGVLAAGLNAVSCASPDACVAVGTFETTKAFESFAEIWSGSQWAVVSTPKARASNLNSVSCTATRSCEAVGDIVTNGIPLTLAEHWNGITWAIQHTPNPAGAARTFLTSVSCPASNACTAIGSSAGRAGISRTLAERWNGKSWKIQRTVNPAGGGISFEGVSCASAKACTAVGSFSTGVFGETWNGSSWKLHAARLPAGSKSAFLSSVSCTSAGACTAAGDFTRGTRIVPVAERWNGTTWTPQLLPPVGAGPSGLSAVSCVSARLCVATGFSGDSDFRPFAERWNGRKWVAQTVFRPGSSSALLNGLSCDSASACMTVGSFTDAMSNEQMFADQYS